MLQVRDTLYNQHMNKVDTTAMTVATYDKMVKPYVEAYFGDTLDIPFIEKFSLLLPKNARILDAGCGPGTHIQHLLPRGYSVEGIDLSNEMLHEATQRFPSATFRRMDLRHLEYESDSFDAVLAAYSLIHVPEAEVWETLQGFHRILKPNGLLMTITQKGQPDHILPDPLLPDSPTFLNLFTTDRLSDSLEQAGFTTMNLHEMPYNDPDNLTDAIIYNISRK